MYLCISLLYQAQQWHNPLEKIRALLPGLADNACDQKSQLCILYKDAYPAIFKKDIMQDL